MKKLNMKDILNRRHEGKQCVGFEIELAPTEYYGKSVLVRFTKGIPAYNGDNGKTWTIEVFCPRSMVTDVQHYQITYELPREGMAIEYIAAVGLTHFQNLVREELQAKTEINFGISEMVEGITSGGQL